MYYKGHFSGRGTVWNLSLTGQMLCCCQPVVRSGKVFPLSAALCALNGLNLIWNFQDLC